MERSRANADVVVPVGLAAVAAVLVLVATRDGMGTTPDGVSYLGAAANLADGRGLTGPFTTMVDPFGPAEAIAFGGEVPFIQWPPLYPLLLGLGAAVGIEPTTTARVLAVACLALTVGGVAWIVGRLAPGAPAVAAAAGTWVLLSPYAALLHVLVASEHLFLALSLGALWCGSRWLAGAPLRGRGSEAWGVLAVALATAATLTRFVGAAVVVALAVGVAFLGHGPLRRRLGVAAGVAALGVGPALVWSQATARAAGVPTRTVAWHPPDRAQWEGVASTLTGWLVPADAPTAVRTLVVALTLAVVALAGLGWRRAWADDEAPAELRPWLVVASTFTVTYVVAVVATHALLDRAVPIGTRLLLPVQPVLAVTVAVGVVWWARSLGLERSRRRAVVAGAAVAALAVLAPLTDSWRPLVEPGRPWAADPATTATGRWLAGRPAGTWLASNDPALAWQSSGAPTIALPVRTSAPTGIDNERFADDLAELAEQLAAQPEGGLAVVYGTSAVLNPHVAGIADLEGAGFTVVATFDDAVVLAPPATG